MYSRVFFFPRVLFLFEFLPVVILIVADFHIKSYPFRIANVSQRSFHNKNNFLSKVEVRNRKSNLEFHLAMQLNLTCQIK